MKLLPALLLLVSVAAFGEPAEVGQPFPSYTLEDAFGVEHTLAPETRIVVVASEKKVSTGVNAWLSAKPADFLVGHHMEYIADIEKMPTLISAMFAKPKMKKLPFRLLLATTRDFAATYPAREGKIAVFLLDENQALTEIRYLDNTSDLDALLEPEQID